ncbi:cwf18 pre-mRNA splicing factor-domain-containing protein [Lasiosphaeria miniovina]|uniref:Cwf18 pre-mRNA splicing factor-domain-containing protein n=1 Tax=Lasiosphaeria miniovina TaxID=1954250 RepID=A0AA40B6I7_9PEZI|nr:cwf18 pre-mRNA splicing factor-domain-containing protein [Lasiosphaeria miniovina]KAK0728611.1 cwf18 pre-mRNA splicing factor-domain-containing protein [Lasiosphaeria miniovina]
MSSHATLSAAADDRKARLAKLKSLKRKQPGEDHDNDGGDSAAPSHDHNDDTTATTNTNNNNDNNDNGEAPPSPPSNDVARLHLSGRNYDVAARGPKLGFEAPPTLGLETATLEEQAASLEEASRRQAAADAADDKGIDLFKLQPKKPNWDLKRELGRKLEVLNARTDNAIARLVRERLAAKKAVASSSSSQSQSSEKAAAAGGDLLDGAALVEGMRLREKEEEEETRRERELEEADLA